MGIPFGMGVGIPWVFPQPFSWLCDGYGDWNPVPTSDLV